MIAYEVQMNGRRLCVAGAPPDGVLTMGLTWVHRNPETVDFHLGGLLGGDSKDHIRWNTPKLKIGDEVVMRIVDTDGGDPPDCSYQPNLDRDRSNEPRVCESDIVEEQGSSNNCAYRTVAFEVWTNGTRLCVAGAPPDGVLSTIVSWTHRTPEQINFHVGGVLGCESKDRIDWATIDWTTPQIGVGDEVTFRIVETDTTDPPDLTQRWTEAHETDGDTNEE